jgi:predicted TIM-barrel fold metal-dependent hydrolase
MTFYPFKALKSKVWYSSSMALIYLVLIQSCNQINTGEQQEDSTPVPQIKKIDFHAHYRSDRDYLIPLFDSLNLQPLLVDVGRVDTANWHRQRKGLIENFQKHPDRYFFCTSFTANEIDDPDYAENIIKHLKHDLDLGARMVKVWKNFGMVSQDNSGAYVHIDDPRIQPVWDFLVEEGIPVLAHIGEPLQAWRPIDENNPHAGYFKNNPQYHAYLHPEIPSWEAIQEARNNWLARNPELAVVGAHNGSMSHDVALMAETLDKYPNFHVEPAARIADLALQDSDSVRDFIIKYQDRFLYGTDFGTSGDASELSMEELEQEKQSLAFRMNAHWLYFSTLDSVEIPRSKPVPTRGLGLPDAVLQKVYYQNAARILKIL